MTDLKNLEAGDDVIYKNVGYGLTSYEEGKGEVVEIKDGRLFTNSFDREGMQWDERTQSWKYDGGLGLVTYAIAADDPKGLKSIREEAEQA